MSTQLSPQIAAQAADWFCRFRTDEVPVFEYEEFLRWLQQSPQHVQAYLDEACTYQDVAPATACAGLMNRVGAPCSIVRAHGSRDGSRRRSHRR